MYARKPLGKFGTKKPESRASRGAWYALQQRQRRSRYLQRLAAIVRRATGAKLERQASYRETLMRMRLHRANQRAGSV